LLQAVVAARHLVTLRELAQTARQVVELVLLGITTPLRRLLQTQDQAAAEIAEWLQLPVLMAVQDLLLFVI
jgi:hypothetical protein